MTRRIHQPGFALLMALVLVMLAGVTLAAVSRESTTAALDANTAEQQLQRRWAVSGMQELILADVEQLMTDADNELLPDELDAAVRRSFERGAVSQMQLAIELVGGQYELVVTDEQAKVNVNALLAEDDRVRAEAIIERLRHHASAKAAVNLNPLVGGDDSDPGDLRAIGGYGQIFDRPRAEQLLGGDIPGLADRVTCWGSGHVNVFSAPDQVLRIWAGQRVGSGAANLLVEARREANHRSLNGLLDELEELDEEQKSELERALTDRSRCFGLWIVAHDNQRRWYELSVGITVPLQDGGSRINERYDLTW